MSVPFIHIEVVAMPAPATQSRLSIFRLTGLLFVLLLLATACGPRFDRAEVTVAGGVPAQTDTGQTIGGGGEVTDGTTTGDTGFDTGTTVDPGTGTTDGTTTAGETTDGSAGAGGTTGSGGTSSGSGGTSSGSGGTSSGSGGTSSGTTGSSGGTTSQPADAGPMPGVSDKTIKIGYLVPLTGAAPIPTSWDDGANLYWDWKADNGGTNGRTIELIIKDTESSTSTAVAEARNLVNEGVFTILTLDRLEVQDAVAKFLEQVGMPHVMIQSPASPPSSWTNTFTVSVDHIVQGRGIANFFSEDLGAAGGAKPVGFVREQTNALKPGTDAFEAQANSLGLDVVAKQTFNPDDPDVTQTVLQLSQSGAEIVWLYMAPTPAARIISQAGAQGYRPIWFANSISWGFELMHGVTGGYMEGAYAFSPWVSLSNPKTANYKKAWRDQGLDGNPDDIGLVGWGAGGVLDQALTNAGQNLGWNTFRNALRNLKVTTDVWSPLDFTGGGSVGAGTVAVYKAEGGAWKTVQEGRRL